MAEEPSGTPRSVADRVPTGIAGLDEVLRGGLVRGASYLILGEPGTGKTTIGNHVAFNHGSRGGIALFVTVLAEAHDRMIMHIGGFDFFQRERIGQTVHYFSLFDDLRQHGLDAGLASIRRLVHDYGASLLVIDGAARLEDFASSRIDYRRFNAELHAQLSLLGCTALLLSQPGSDNDALHTLGTHVDGIMSLEDRSIGARDIRFLRMLKQRGGETVRGYHEFAITTAGVEVYPRLESVLEPVRARRRSQQKRHLFGVDGLDDMLMGGLLTGTTTLVIGPPGIGKTTTGLHFIADGAHRGERGLIASFQEAPEQLIAKADTLGLDLGGQVETGRIRLRWEPSWNRPLDEWVGDLLAAIAEHQPQRLIIDSLTDMVRLVVTPERLPGFMAAIMHALRAHGVATIFTVEAPTVEGTELVVPLPEATAGADNAILLRYVEPRSRLHRLVSILRVRESGFDPNTREFSITDHGIEVKNSPDSAAAILGEAAGPAITPSFRTEQADTDTDRGE